MKCLSCTLPQVTCRMSTSLNCQQFNSAYYPASKLGNWEVPASHRVKDVIISRPPGFRTTAIVDDNGHLLPGVPKRMTSFSGTASSGNGRWPRDPTANFSGSATMGYKGIQTLYLPSSTVMPRNNPDSVCATSTRAVRPCSAPAP